MAHICHDFFGLKYFVLAKGFKFRHLCAYPPPPESKSADSLIWEGVGRDYGGEIAVVVIVRAVVTPVVWGRGDVRHDVAGKGAGAG